MATHDEVTSLSCGVLQEHLPWHCGLCPRQCALGKHSELAWSTLVALCWPQNAHQKLAEEAATSRAIGRLLLARWASGIEDESCRLTTEVSAWPAGDTGVFCRDRADSAIVPRKGGAEDSIMQSLAELDVTSDGQTYSSARLCCRRHGSTLQTQGWLPQLCPGKGVQRTASRRSSPRATCSRTTRSPSLWTRRTPGALSQVNLCLSLEYAVLEGLVTPPPRGGTRDMFVHHQKSVSMDAQDPRCALISHEALHHEHSGLQSARATCCTHPEVRHHERTESQVT